MANNAAAPVGIDQARIAVDRIPDPAVRAAAQEFVDSIATVVSGALAHVDRVVRDPEAMAALARELELARS